jgi:hypothetical protein
MAKVSDAEPLELLSSHPSHGTRFETLQAELEAAQTLRQAAREQGRQPDCSFN